MVFTCSNLESECEQWLRLGCRTLDRAAAVKDADTLVFPAPFFPLSDQWFPPSVLQHPRVSAQLSQGLAQDSQNHLLLQNMQNTAVSAEFGGGEEETCRKIQTSKLSVTLQKVGIAALEKRNGYTKPLSFRSGLDQCLGAAAQMQP